MLAREDAPGEKRLVAYVIPNAAAASPAELRGYLKQKLPEYMVPAAFVSLTAFPKTPNGKVDRRALPAPEPARSATKAGSAVLHDPVELELTMLWESLLGMKSIGLDENFFDLGGHSLLAVRLFAQIAQVFGKRLPLAALFQAPTIEQLAEVLRKEADSHVWPTMIPIQPLGGRPPFFCVAAPNVNALGYAFLARHLGQDQPLYGLQSPFREQSEGPYTQAEYEALARDYLAAMRTVQPEGPYYLGGMCEGAHIAFEMARQLDAQGEEVGLLAVLDAWPTENTISPFFWAVRHYLKLLRAFRQMGMAERFHFLLGKAKGLLRVKESALLPKPAKRAPEDVFHARVWPGKDFVPPQFSGKITLFRARRQPYWRVWDYRNGWGCRALGGVEVGPRGAGFVRETTRRSSGSRTCRSWPGSWGNACKEPGRPPSRPPRSPPELHDSGHAESSAVTPPPEKCC